MKVLNRSLVLMFGMIVMSHVCPLANCCGQDDWKNLFLVVPLDDKEISPDYVLFDEVSRMALEDTAVRSLFSDDERKRISEIRREVFLPNSLAMMNRDRNVDLDQAWFLVEANARQHLGTVATLIGSERMKKLAYRSNQKDLAETLMDFSVPSLGIFSSTKLSQVFGATKSQIESAEQTKKELQKQLEENRTSILENIDSERNTYFNKMMAILKAGQRRIARRRIGKPLSARISSDQQLTSAVKYYLDQAGTGTVIESSSNAGKPQGQDGPIVPANKQEPAIEIDYLLHKLLHFPWIKRELDLSTEQDIELRRSFDVNKTRLTFDHANRVLENLIGGNRKYPQWLEDTLLASQVELLAQIEFQIRSADNADSFGLLHPKMIAHLKLTRQQQDRIRAIADENRQSLTRLAKELQAINARSIADAEKKIRHLLTPKQKQMIQFYTGVHID